MLARKFALAGAVVGLLGLGLAVAAPTLTTGGDDDPPIGVVLDASTGLPPIGDTVDFLADRADARPDDHLTRVQLAAAWSTLGREQADLDAYAEAEAAARSALAIRPDHEPARLQLADALTAQHRFAEGRELAEAVLAENPDSEEAALVVATVDLATGRYDDAERALLALAGPDRPAPLVSALARVALDRGDHVGAVALAEEALARSEDLVRRPNEAAFYHFQLGHVRFATGDVEGAVDALRAALAVDPGHVGATEELAFVLAATGELDEAERLYRVLLDEGPAADLHGSYADLLVELGRRDEAAVQERLGVALAAETIDRHPAERRHLAGFYASRDPETALALARADRAERADSGAFDTLAWALHRTGADAEAAEVMAEVLAIGTDTAAVRYHAGVIAAANGDVEGAVGHLRAAIERNPDFAPGDADHARELLAELT